MTEPPAAADGGVGQVPVRRPTTELQLDSPGTTQKVREAYGTIRAAHTD
jgi:hypothetical protein